MSVKFSVIIPTCNNREYLVRCLEGIRMYTGRDDVEVFVVNNGCTDGTPAIVKALGFNVITLTENLGFSAACNLGANKAHGDYFVFLNDDTIVGPHWLSRMHKCWLTGEAQTGGLGPIGAVGPMSNNVSREQRVNMDSGMLRPETVTQVAHLLSERGSYMPTSFLCGFCLMVPRSVWGQVEQRVRARTKQPFGAFDCTFAFGCEDNVFCADLDELGYMKYIAGDAYVWHFGHTTFDRPEFDKYRRGTLDRHRMNMMFKRKRGSQKVVAIYRVKIRNDREAQYMTWSLAQMLKVAHHICILDDNSTHCGIRDVLEAAYAVHGVSIPISSGEVFPDGICNATVKEAGEREFDERRDRNEVIDMAREEGADWVLSCDSDEVYENALTRERLEKLVTGYNPETINFFFHFYTMWDSETRFRADDVWGRMVGPRLHRLLPNSKIVMGTEEHGFHCGNVPWAPQSASCITDLRIKHFGYMHSEDRQRKFQWYTRMDPDPDPVKVGHDDYTHLIEEKGIRLWPWKEDNSITVGSLMCDETAFLPDYLCETDGFGEETVLLDTGSVDGSTQMAEEAGARVVQSPIKWERKVDSWQSANFAGARNALLAEIRTPVYFHLDPDERVHNWAEVRRRADMPGIGAHLFFVNNYEHTREGGGYSETIRLMHRPVDLYYTGYLHETVDEAVRACGLSVSMVPAERCVIHHYGFIRGDGKSVHDKLVFYLLASARQYRDLPHDPRPAFAIALQFLTYPPFEERAIELLRECIRREKGHGAAYWQLIQYHARAIRVLGQMMLKPEIVAPAHPSAVQCRDLMMALGDASRPISPKAPGHIQDALAILADRDPDLLKIVLGPNLEYSLESQVETPPELSVVGGTQVEQVAGECPSEVSSSTGEPDG